MLIQVYISTAFGAQKIAIHFLFHHKNIIHSEGGLLVSIGGMPDHIHLLVETKPTESISRLIRCIKSESSKLIRQSHPNLENFSWQRSYGSFSVSYSISGAVTKYIQNQATHHKNKSFNGTA
ncbi:MAG: IS200/IS605 family transposase [bacterium]